MHFKVIVRSYYSYETDADSLFIYASLLEKVMLF